MSAGAESTGEAVGDTADGWMPIETRLGAGTASAGADFFCERGGGEGQSGVMNSRTAFEPRTDPDGHGSQTDGRSERFIVGPHLV